MPKFLNYAPDFRNYAHKNDVDSVRVGAQKQHQIMMFFKYVVVVNLFVFYGSLSRHSVVQTAYAKFAKRRSATKHVRTKSIILLA